MFKIFFLILAIITILISLNYHIQNPVAIWGGAVTVVIIHLAIAGGAAHIVPAVRKHIHGDKKQVNGTQHGK